MAVIITDGRSNIDVYQTIPSATALKESGTTVFAVGVGDKLDLFELNAIVSSPDKLLITSVTNYEGVKSKITADACIGTISHYYSEF